MMAISFGTQNVESNFLSQEIKLAIHYAVFLPVDKKVSLPLIFLTANDNGFGKAYPLYGLFEADCA
uniref:Uncharacterized protein n=1 Tax=Parascaris equorum TaxID=6256 RepID=A0A914RHL2_PAREQ